jgi:hypothetical protein
MADEQMIVEGTDPLKPGVALAIFEHVQAPHIHVKGWYPWAL